MLIRTSYFDPRIFSLNTFQERAVLMMAFVLQKKYFHPGIKSGPPFDSPVSFLPSPFSLSFKTVHPSQKSRRSISFSLQIKDLFLKSSIDKFTVGLNSTKII